MVYNILNMQRFKFQKKKESEKHKQINSTYLWQHDRHLPKKNPKVTCKMHIKKL